jgi:arginine/ornithine N-succinyltransferase beta subunit
MCKKCTEYGFYIMDIGKDNRLRTCFLSEIRDLMCKYQVFNLSGSFNNEGNFNVSQFNLNGVGSAFYDLNYSEPDFLLREDKEDEIQDR